MSIANELSSEVAVWFAHRATANPAATTAATNSHFLAQIVLELHATLQHLKSEERAARRSHALLPRNPRSSAVGNH